jgi:hypothetical protein
VVEIIGEELISKRPPYSSVNVMIDSSSNAPATPYIKKVSFLFFLCRCQLTLYITPNHAMLFNRFEFGLCYMFIGLNEKMRNSGEQYNVMYDLNNPIGR